jgi:hypothetical protein
MTASPVCTTLNPIDQSPNQMIGTRTSHATDEATTSSGPQRLARTIAASAMTISAAGTM